MNTFILSVLVIIALCEIWRVVLVYKPVSKREFFKKRLQKVINDTWDLEFQRFKTEEVREDIRKIHDGAQAKKAALEIQVKNWPKDKDQGDKARLEDEIVRSNRDIERYKAQMAEIDVSIHGSKPTADHPDGADGMDQRIASYMEVQSMLKDWIKFHVR